MNQYIYAGTSCFNKAWKRLYTEIIRIKKISEAVPEEFLLLQISISI